MMLSELTVVFSVILMVFRTLNDIDYECVVEIVTSSNQYLVTVVRYPTTIAKNCEVNRDALTVLKKWKCTRLCDLLSGEAYTPYFTFTVKNRLRFLFKSNSSINSDINANFYQVTITSARQAPFQGCNRRNETICTVDQLDFCFTTGVVCDGIENCGVDDWFDERKSQCTLPVQRLGYAPIVAVMAVFICAVVAGGHALVRLLPPHANSFFVFNENEDNRLCIDPVLVPRGNAPGVEAFKRVSIIPVLDSITESDNDSNTEESQMTTEKEQNLYDLEDQQNEEDPKIIQSLIVEEKPEQPARKSTMKSLAEKFQKLMSSRYVASGAGSNRKNKDSIA
ncbi:uncharacterized protein LOC123878102 isoform X2 [Maniola jurtina]|uniref:uncharacterized protein LOC123878102 isoform X2 n=1 Tax=Maniola jurtina TaxID=191418 RepID=UPI001E685E2F|nr:uncharacterized protein LOC123878102 isoform X2 [Maniola jurtina]